ncbi:hypothetical protein FHY11_002221 [Xanthomonas arboricola]|uniref:hypothetical protein n=1 Tax=Xanthomonas euroxanthea TaxID=2259622 RepID=UPI00141AB2C9|nr:hypothetical protein [Xanthomonas euroxanthea]NIK08711.1 hypothetical protein [Xanthomonas euroxanthea]
MSDELIHLNKIHADGHSKYVYFLLAATGAALGYALQKIDSSTYNCQVWFGLFAIGFWLLSFFFGCMHVTAIQSAVLSNSHLLQLQQGNHPMQPRTQQEMEIARRITSDALESKNNKAQLLFRLQFWLLATGVLLFTTWSILVLVGTAQSAP